MFRRLVKAVFPTSLIKVVKNIVKPYPLVQGYNKGKQNHDAKKVLISYLTAPLEINAKKSITHSNIAEAAEIIDVFLKLNYEIDLIHCLDDSRNVERISKKKYDVIFGLGNPFYMAAKSNPDAIKIIYLTESHPEFVAKQVQGRMHSYYQRHARSIPAGRPCSYYESQHIDVADCAILLGNYITAASYNSCHKPIYTISPTGLINQAYEIGTHLSCDVKRRFVWFGSDGALHKGLDLVLDAFMEHKDCELFICGLSQSDRRYFKEFPPHVHDLGFMSVDSADFIELMQSCGFVILPSCAEGMSTSVITCMNHGLVPIITRETGIDLGAFGFFLANDTVADIVQIIHKCKAMENGELQRERQGVYTFARKQYGLEQFSQAFEAALLTALENSGE